MRITDQVTYYQPKPVLSASVLLVNLAFADEQPTQYTGQAAACAEHDGVVVQYSLSTAQPTAATHLVRYQLATR